MPHWHRQYSSPQHRQVKGLLTGMVFLDLSKALDTLDHAHLLQKLSRFGFTSSSVQWFNAYLSSRMQSIVIDGILSET